METKVKDLLIQLKKLGFIETRVRGDHHRFVDGKGHHVTVSYTKIGENVRKGTLNAILKDAGIK